MLSLPIGKPWKTNFGMSLSAGNPHTYCNLLPNGHMMIEMGYFVYTCNRVLIRKAT